MGLLTTIKRKIADKVLAAVLESNVSPIGWLNGYKTIIGTILQGIGGILAAVSAALLAVQQVLCPGWEYCGQLDATILAVAVLSGFVTKLSGLLIKYLGEWHKAQKEIKVLDAKRI